MNVGAQLIAPKGCGPLASARTYYLLAHQPDRQRVLLVWFTCNAPSAANNGTIARAYLMAIDQDSFESGLLCGAIQWQADQQHMPPWLEELGSRNPNSLDRNKQRTLSNRERVQRRMTLIQPAIQHLDSILDADEPIKALNKVATKNRANTSRYRLLVLTFVIFGRNPWALLPAYHRIGHWDRSTASSSKTLGRRPTAKYRVNAPRLSDEDKELILRSYYKYRGRGITRRAIYIKAIKAEWKCKAARNAEGHFEIFQPQGKAFPSFRQYEYHLLKTIGREQLQIDRFGPEGVRNRLSISAGSYAQYTANLLERVEADAYWSKAFPVGPDNRPTPKLVIVRLRDTLSGCIVGVGFSHGAEREDAYCGAFFCAAIGLEHYLQLFGLGSEEFDMPNPGLMQTAIFDRGPGAGRRLADTISIRELSPSYSGQSKGIVESSHPRSDHIAGKPSHKVSHQSPVAMARQELWRAVSQNHDSNTVDRLTPDMAAANVPANPMGIWQYMAQRGRTSAVAMAFDEAARQFLRPATFTLDRSGISFHHLRFSASTLRLKNNLANMGTSTLQGYVLPMCVRHAWVEIDDQLYQVDAQLPFQDDEEQLYLSLRELQDHKERITAARTTQQDNMLGARLNAESSYQMQTGQTFDRWERRSGRPKVKTRTKQRTAKLLKPMS